MAMTASTFLGHYKRIKAHLEQHAAASAELHHAYEHVAAAFKRTYTPEALKQALGADEHIPSDLEDKLASALVLLNRERTLAASHAEPEGAPEAS